MHHLLATSSNKITEMSLETQETVAHVQNVFERDLLRRGNVDDKWSNQSIYRYGTGLTVFSGTHAFVEVFGSSTVVQVFSGFEAKSFIFEGAISHAGITKKSIGLFDNSGFLLPRSFSHLQFL